MRTHLVRLAAFLSVAAASPDQPPEKLPLVAARGLKAVTVAVVDGASGAPVTAFSYEMWYEAPGYKSPPNGDVWTPVVSRTGTFEIQAPGACRLTVRAKAS